jgi:O-antigen/teichoic acid export membrane protein
LVIRWLGKEDYGQLVLALSIYAMSSIFLDPGIGKLIVSEVAKERGEQQSGKIKYLLVRYGQMELAIGFFFLFTMFVSSHWLSVFIPKEIVLLIGLYLFFTGIKNVFFNTFYSHTLYHYQALLEILGASFRLILIIIFLGLLDMGLVGAMATYPLSLIFAIFFISPFWLKSVSYLKKIKIQNVPIFPTLLKEQGKFVILLTPVKTIQDQIPVWIVRGILGVEAVAIYGVAQKAFGFIYSFYNSLETAIFPLISETIISQWSQVKEIVGRSIKYSFWISILVVPALWITAPMLFELAFTERYIISITVFRYFLLVLFIYSFLLVQRPLFFALEALNYHFFCYLLGIPLYIFLLLVLIAKIGVPGAPLALLGHSIFLANFRFHFLRKIKSDFQINLLNLFQIDSFDLKMLKRLWGRLART